MMEIICLVGNDIFQIDRFIAEKTKQLQVEKLDLSEDTGNDLLNAISMPSLFNEKRVIIAYSLENLTKDTATKISKAANTSTALLILRGEKLTLELKKILSPIMEIKTISLPNQKQSRPYIIELFKNYNLALHPEILYFFIEHQIDIVKVQNIAKQFSIAGMTKPTLAQVKMLTGSTEKNSMVWDVSDSLENKDLKKALEKAQSIEPIALILYLQNRWMQIAKLIEKDIKDNNTAAAELKLNYAFQAEKLLRTSKKVNTTKIVTIYSILAQAEKEAKTLTKADFHLEKHLLLLYKELL